VSDESKESARKAKKFMEAFQKGEPPWFVKGSKKKKKKKKKERKKRSGQMRTLDGEIIGPKEQKRNRLRVLNGKRETASLNAVSKKRLVCGGHPNQGEAQTKKEKLQGKRWDGTLSATGHPKSQPCFKTN